MIVDDASDGFRDPILDAIDADTLDVFLKRVEHLCADEKGPDVFPDNMCHKVVDEPAILQLSGRGTSRFLFFFVANKGIVFTHAFLKRGGKTSFTPRSEKKRATAKHDEFQRANELGHLEWNQEPPEYPETPIKSEENPNEP